jgi:hypothetical protein
LKEVIEGLKNLSVGAKYDFYGMKAIDVGGEKIKDFSDFVAVGLKFAEKLKEHLRYSDMISLWGHLCKNA